MIAYAVRSKAAILFMFIHCLMLLELSVAFFFWSLFCDVVRSGLSSFAIITLSRKTLVALLFAESELGDFNRLIYCKIIIYNALYSHRGSF